MKPAGTLPQNTSARIFGYTGRTTLSALAYLGGLLRLFGEALTWSFVWPFRGKPIRRAATFQQMVRVGFRSVPIVGMVLFFVGVILALQMAYVLQKFGVTQYIASVVGVGIIRELGPLITAIVMTGFAGASIAAELGTMKVSEEILALETSALDPMRFLVVPRVLACMVMFLCLTILGDLIGIFGGFCVSVSFLDVDPYVYFHKTTEYLINKDIVSGLVKAEVFGIIVSLVACYEGLSVEGGAEGVGRATTMSVVLSIVFIILADCILTWLFYFLLK